MSEQDYRDKAGKVKKCLSNSCSYVKPTKTHLEKKKDKNMLCHGKQAVACVHVEFVS